MKERIEEELAKRTNESKRGEKEMKKLRRTEEDFGKNGYVRRWILREVAETEGWRC